MDNILNINNKDEFREWLSNNHDLEKECYIKDLKRGNPNKGDNYFYYIDAVYVALSYGWIDSLYKKIDGILYQRFSPRKKNSNWTALNLARIKYLEREGLINESAYKYLPINKYKYDEDVIEDIKKIGVFEIFSKLPTLCKQVKVSNLASLRRSSIEKYYSSLNSLISKIKNNKIGDEWSDFGRLKDIEL